jgi:cephalosporin hydroxylase
MRNELEKKGLLDLINYIKQLYNTKDLTILEIGSFTGGSAVIFAEHFKKVFCIDAWSNETLSKWGAPYNWIKNKMTSEGIEKQFNENIKRFENIEKTKGLSVDIAENFNNKIDVLYIDAGHDYESVKNDILAWKDKVNLFICGHDYDKEYPGEIQAINELLGNPEKIFLDTSFLFKVK